MERRPNVVFVLTDDQGYPPLGCHGHPFLKTPNIDAFHEQAVCFEQFHSGTTCAPTRAGLLTGCYCNSTGVWHTVGGRSLLRSDEWTLASALQENGYSTGLFGKWHLGDHFPFRPQDRGFDEVICHGGGGISQQPDFWGNDYFDDTYLVNGEAKAFTGYCTDVFFREGIRFIEEHRTKPFFTFISTNAPHTPLNVPSRYFEMYQKHTPDERYARFLGMISNIDENFGLLYAKLEELQLLDDTVLIFGSDNGQALLAEEEVQYNGGLRGGKSSPYEGGHRIPLLLNYPKQTVKKSVDTLASYIDFMPTILDLCKITVPKQHHFHGRSLLPLLCKAEAEESWKQRYFVTDTQRIPYPIKWLRSCVAQDKWRLVNRHELYDIQVDPAQKNNIATKHKELVQELQQAYENWWDLCSEQFDSEIAAVVGSENCIKTRLYTHDLRNEAPDGAVWNQKEVRSGVQCNGYWPVHFTCDGLYRFTMRRWPEEAARAIQAGIDGEDISWNRAEVDPDFYDHYCGGAALPLNSACVLIQGLPRQSVDVEPAAKSAVVEMQIPQGIHELRAFLLALDGSWISSAFYLDIEKIK